MAMLQKEDFLGRWVLERAIADRYGQQDGQMAGHADFALQGDGLIYRESGRLQLRGGAVMQAERRYLWRFDPDRVVVRFADGAAFHQFVPLGSVAGSDHPCGEDFYRVAYDFTGWPEWQAVWTVTGPRKDYTSVSRYRRAGAA